MRTTRLLCTWLFWLLILCLLPACGSEDETELPDRATIGPNGGVLEGSGGLVLEIPLGALAEEIELSIQETTMPGGGLVQVGRFYRLEPVETLFSIPATLRIPYNPDSIPDGRREADIRLFHFDEDGAFEAAAEAPDRNRRIAQAAITRLGVWGAALPAAETAALPPALSAPSEVDFGLVALGDTDSQSLLLRNGGGGDLILALVALETGAAFHLAAPPAPETRIPPYSELVVSLSFSPGEQAFYEDTLRIESNDPQRPLVDVPLRGRGAGGGKIATDPEALAFPPTPVGESDRLSLTIRNDGDGPLLLLGFGLPAGEIFEVADPPLGERLNTGETLDISVIFAPKEAVFYQLDLRIESDDAENPRHEVRLTGEGG